jgi:hypothetical protein
MRVILIHPSTSSSFDKLRMTQKATSSSFDGLRMTQKATSSSFDGLRMTDGFILRQAQDD